MDVEQKLSLPRGVKRRRSRAEIIAYIDGLPDTAPVSTYEAATYLGIHSKTLKRWRIGYKRKAYVPKSERRLSIPGEVVEKDDGTIFVEPVKGAPLATKHRAANSTAQNQGLHWIVGDLKRFVKELATRSTFEAATMDMRSFAGRWDQLSQERPWFAADGVILGEATSAPAKVFNGWKRRDGSVELLSLSIVEAMCDYDWQQSEARAPWNTWFCDELRRFLGDAVTASEARQHSLMLSERPAKPGRPHPARSRIRS